MRELAGVHDKDAGRNRRQEWLISNPLNRLSADIGTEIGILDCEAWWWVGFHMSGRYFIVLSSSAVAR